MVQERPGPQVSGVVGGIERFKNCIRNGYCTAYDQCKNVVDIRETNLKFICTFRSHWLFFYFWKFASTSVIGGAVERN